MKYTSIIKSGLILTAVAMLAVTACKKNDSSTSTPSNADDNGGYASDAAKMETNSNDVISISDVAASGQGSTLRTTGATALGCATVATVSPTEFTITFPSAGCVCADGKTRAGQIIVNYTGTYTSAGSVHTITYNNYFVNSNQIKGTKTVTNEGLNSSGQTYYNVTVNDTMITPGDSVISWAGSRVRTCIVDSSDRIYNVYEVSEGAGGPTVLTRADGNSFNFDITSPLYISLNCPYIEAGIVSITGATLSSARTLNYGTAGVCNPTAQLTVDGVTYTILIHTL